jgi:hypothetical protein
VDKLGMNQLNVNGLKNGKRNVMMTVKQAIGLLPIQRSVRNAMPLLVINL